MTALRLSVVLAKIMFYLLLDFSITNPVITTDNARKIATGKPKAHTIEMPNNAPPIESDI